MAKKNNTKRKLVGLVSEESGVRAYYTKKNTMNTPDKLSLKKYDPVLRKHVVSRKPRKILAATKSKKRSAKNNPSGVIFCCRYQFYILCRGGHS